MAEVSVIDISGSRALSAAMQRILVTADRLFYQEGIRVVGVDWVVSQTPTTVSGHAKLPIGGHGTAR